MIPKIQDLKVYHNHVLVGNLSLLTHSGQAVFKYDRNWLAHGFPLNPLSMPLEEKTFIASLHPFAGNFGVFEDSLPDGYGRYLLDRMLKKSHGCSFEDLDPIQKLSLIGTGGMGSLSYLPEWGERTPPVIASLDQLQEQAFSIFEEKSISDPSLLYFHSGNSGGCRPKVLLSDNDGHWLVKMRHKDDPIDIGEKEYLCNKAAKGAGIRVPDVKLIENKYFACRRFDIDEQEEKIYTITAGGLLNLSRDDLSADYSHLLKLTGFLTQSPGEVEEMYRRMVFNVFIGNKDDHVKNFSFQYLNIGWCLAPAYDLTQFPKGYRGEHATTVMGQGNPDLSDLIRAGKAIRIPQSRCQEIITQVKKSVLKHHLLISSF